MIIYSEKNLSDFDFWGYAKENAETLTEEQMAIVEACLSEMYPNGIKENELNDWFRFSFDTIKEWIKTGEEDE